MSCSIKDLLFMIVLQPILQLAFIMQLIPTSVPSPTELYFETYASACIRTGKQKPLFLYFFKQFNSEFS